MISVMRMWVGCKVVLTTKGVLSSGGGSAPSDFPPRWPRNVYKDLVADDVFPLLSGLC